MIRMQLSPRERRVHTTVEIGFLPRLDDPTPEELDEQARGLAEALRESLPESVLNYLRRSL